MTLDTLKNADRVIGIKQVTKAVNKGLAVCVFAADDADGRVTEPLKELCSQKGVELVNVPTMEEQQRQRCSSNSVVKNLVFYIIYKDADTGLLINNKFSI